MKNIPSTASNARRAFTLLEVMVVAAVIGVLVALLLPAVQSTREAARRSTCANNLVQLMTAVTQYEHAHQKFPPGVVNGVRPIRNQPKGYHHSWMVQILPFREEKNTWRYVDFKLSVYHPKNAQINAQALSLQTCSSNPGNMGGSGYAGVHHDVEAPIDVDNSGVFFLNSGVRRLDVVDGLSHTAFIGEKVSDAVDFGWMSGTRSTLRNTGTPLNISGLNKPGSGVGVENELKDTQPEEEIIDAYGFGDALPKRRDRSEDDDAFLMPGGMSGGGGGFSVGGFSSYHQGVVQFAFGDGSVHPVAAVIDSITLQRMANRANRDLREGDW